VSLKSPGTQYLETRNITFSYKSVNCFLINAKQRSYVSDCQGWLSIGLHENSYWVIRIAEIWAILSIWEKLIIENVLILV